MIKGNKAIPRLEGVSAKVVVDVKVVVMRGRVRGWPHKGGDARDATHDSYTVAEASKAYPGGCRPVVWSVKEIVVVVVMVQA
ncbi:hypothetical protein E2C01_090818 [Portunus trituberculatus]|uniref:Uncharacterized protein n=1 Tax=Portunus trituberculatus TaxID=210409 RepID=A0A5B7JCE0_PORTR|nr:hypothetical protein [Portunus trituberculatus]